MSDANIRVSVDTSEIDVALAKLDAALERVNGVSGAVAAKPASAEQSDFSAFWTRIDAEAAEAKRKVDDTVTEGEAKLAVLKAKTVTTKIEATNLLNNEAPKIKGLEQAAKRIASMLPGLREANTLQTNLKSLSAGNIVGVIGILMLVVSIYRQVVSMMEEQKRREEEYKRQVMQLRGFTTNQEFEAWQNSQRQAQEQWRSQSPTIIS